MSESLITKKALSESLKNLMVSKSFDKITIADITKNCGLNRQTFYYHFQDKYELINWIYYNEAIIILSKDLTYNNWSDRLLEMLICLKKESYFYENALKSSGREEFEKYLLSFIQDLFINIIKKISENYSISADDVNFIAQFYSFGCVGYIVSWAKTGMTVLPENIMNYVKNLVYDSRMFAIKRFLDQNTDCNLLEYMQEKVEEKKKEKNF